MSTIFILQNQEGYFLSKNKDWVDGRDANTLYRSQHKDEAINMLFEVNSRDFNLRISVKQYDTNAKNVPIIPVDELPLPATSATVDTETITDDSNSSDKHQPADSHSDEQLNNNVANA